MKDLEKRNLVIARFVESKTDSITQQEVSSVLLSMGSEGANSQRANKGNCGDCSNWAEACEGLSNGGSCKNYLGHCNGTINGNHCYIAPPPQPNFTVNCSGTCV